MKEYIISKNEEGIRYDKYIKKILRNMPDNLLYKLFRKKYFELNKKRARGNETLKYGDKVSIFIGDDTYSKYATADEKNDSYKQHVGTNHSQQKKEIKSRIIYEDENIILYNKPAGLLSQGDKGNDISVNDVLKEYVKSKDKLYTPSIVNRLDRNTAGIIIFAKTYIAAREISKMIKENNLTKHYTALVNGVVKKQQEKLIHLYKKDEKNNKAIIKDYNGKIPDGYSKIELDYKVKKKYADSTLLDVNLITGKSHQIRAELSYIGYPIVCDKKYMSAELYNKNVAKYGKKSQELTCYKVKFGSFDTELLKNIDNKTFSLE